MGLIRGGTLMCLSDKPIVWINRPNKKEKNKQTQGLFFSILSPENKSCLFSFFFLLVNYSVNIKSLRNGKHQMCSDVAVMCALTVFTNSSTKRIKQTQHLALIVDVYFKWTTFCMDHNDIVKNTFSSL